MILGVCENAFHESRPMPPISRRYIPGTREAFRSKR